MPGASSEKSKRCRSLPSRRWSRRFASSIAVQVRLQVGRVEEGGPVDARELRAVLVAAPVGAGEREELHRLDRRCVLQVRPAAEVDEVALLVQGDVALGRVDELDLERLALLLEVGAGLVAARLAPLEDAALGDLAPDLLLEAGQRLFGHGLGELEVVVEAVLDRRADRHLRPGVEPPRRLGEQVRGRVAQHVEGVGVAAVARGEDLDPLAVRKGRRRSRTLPFARTRTACSASFGPIARAASSPLAPSGSSSSVSSGRITRMEPENTATPRAPARSPRGRP